MNTGIKQLHGHFDRHRSFLVAAGLLGKLRARHQSGWVMRVLKEEFGTFGVGLVGGYAEIGKRLNATPGNQFEECERMRQQIISRFKSSD
ncbi:hypothetical protein E4Q23_06860 [Candidatus Accumulibacter phosphatis]|uniref:Uncharacterized protein n=2 Tax=Candidatus Accumulibacter TaxID=327159 RepID=A0ABX1TVN6_9PROT|nr:hypothetical protein [Candidatus Accumulibacter phosphatis]NMQ27500.1 hypothetical protein [Candidatus Accumulibacter phosphatis]